MTGIDMKIGAAAKCICFTGQLARVGSLSKWKNIHRQRQGRGRKVNIYALLDTPEVSRPCMDYSEAFIRYDF
jgi:hypothetical protein